jgi:O-antigen/teichoic acid export membrane protein
MKNFLSKFYIKIISYFYKLIYKEELTETVLKFLNNLSYVGFGTIVSIVFTFTFNIIAGRLLGPSGYGEFSLVQSIALFLAVPMFFGINYSMLKYNSEKEDFERQQKIISTTYILIFIFTSISIFFYFLLSNEISQVFSVSTSLFYLSIFFATVYVFYTVVTSTLASLHAMKKFALFRLVYSIILLATFFIFIFVNFISSQSMIFSICITYGITGGIILVYLRKFVKLKFDKVWASTLTRYGSYALIGGISSAFYLNIDKILINKYMDTASIGIYWAYSYSFTMAILTILSIFEIVFFPLASKITDKAIIFKKINKFIPFLIIIGIPFMVGSGFIILKLYGSEYPFDLKLAILFGIVGIFVSIDKFYGLLMNSTGKKGKRIVSLAAIVLAVSDVLLNIWLIPIFGIEGAVIAAIFSYLFSIIIVLSKRKYIYNPEVIIS